MSQPQASGLPHRSISSVRECYVELCIIIRMLVLRAIHTRIVNVFSSLWFLIDYQNYLESGVVFSWMSAVLAWDTNANSEPQTLENGLLG